MISLLKKKKNLFIHIPKTGGSSFVGLLKETANLSDAQMQIPSHMITSIKNTEVSHVDFKSQERFFKRPDIFDPKNSASLKKQFDIFMIVRHPVQRVVSEFNFQYNILNGKAGSIKAGIIIRLPKPPKNLEQYISNPHVQNYQIKFLLGRKLADPSPVSEDEFQRIIKTIEDLPIHCGVTDEYSDFLNTFQEVSRTNLNTQVTVRKKTPQEMKIKVSWKLGSKIERLNDYDMRLYLHVKDKLNKNGTTDQFLFHEPKNFTI